VRASSLFRPRSYRAVRRHQCLARRRGPHSPPEGSSSHSASLPRQIALDGTRWKSKRRQSCRTVSWSLWWKQRSLDLGRQRRVSPQFLLLQRPIGQPRVFHHQCKYLLPRCSIPASPRQCSFHAHWEGQAADPLLDQEHVRFVIFHDEYKTPDAGRRFFKQGQAAEKVHGTSNFRFFRNALTICAETTDNRQQCSAI
jgi:hypothetical protein